MKKNSKVVAVVRRDEVDRPEDKFQLIAFVLAVAAVALVAIGAFNLTGKVTQVQVAGPCVGIPNVACSDFNGSESLCNGHLCSFNPNICSGSPADCSTHSYSDCLNFGGCSQNPSCSGTLNCTNFNNNQSLCVGSGCDWGGFCNGTVVHTNSCIALNDSECGQVSGCQWVTPTEYCTVRNDSAGRLHCKTMNNYTSDLGVWESMCLGTPNCAWNPNPPSDKCTGSAITNACYVYDQTQCESGDNTNNNDISYYCAWGPGPGYCAGTPTPTCDALTPLGDVVCGATSGCNWIGDTPCNNQRTNSESCGNWNENEDVCELAGCSYTPHCSGTPSACDTYNDNASACSNALGCSPTTSCSGTPYNCSTYSDNSTACSSTPGCNSTVGCMGALNCTKFNNNSSLCSASGCNWNASCSGTVPCNYFNISTCAQHSPYCNWSTQGQGSCKPTSPGGSYPCPSDQQSCGNYGAHCTWSATCSSSGVQSCANWNNNQNVCGQAGCLWAQSCTGMPPACNNWDSNQGLCELTGGCLWGQSCTGTPVECGSRGQQDCTGECSWSPYCTGTPSACDTYTSQLSCEVADCSWYSSTCSGSISCGLFNSSASCDGISGCGWDNDGDGYAGLINDCNDSDYSIHPGATEVCNGVDDNCNVDVDEGLGTATTTCGLGECNHTVTDCSGGVPQTCDPMDGATSEICNGLDDDCDGSVDEDFTDLGQSCTAGSSNCQASGVYVCANDGLSTVCDAVPGQPASDDNCNGIDDDCDDVVDDDYMLVPTTCGLGACASTGQLTCENGSLVDSCTNGTSGTELCDANFTDENCDGSANEGCACNETQALSCYSGPTGTEGVGICHAGIQTCDINGTWEDCSGVAYPANETCNGLDDDCNGVVDDGETCAINIPGGFYAEGKLNPDNSTEVCVYISSNNSLNGRKVFCTIVPENVTLDLTGAVISVSDKLIKIGGLNVTKVVYFYNAPSQLCILDQENLASLLEEDTCADSGEFVISCGGIATDPSDGSSVTCTLNGTTAVIGSLNHSGVGVYVVSGSTITKVSGGGGGSTGLRVGTIDEGGSTPPVEPTGVEGVAPEEGGISLSPAAGTGTSLWDVLRLNVLWIAFIILGLVIFAVAYIIYHKSKRYGLPAAQSPKQTV